MQKPKFVVVKEEALGARALADGRDDEAARLQPPVRPCRLPLPGPRPPQSSFHADHHSTRRPALVRHFSPPSTPIMATAKIASLLIRVSPDGG